MIHRAQVVVGVCTRGGRLLLAERRPGKEFAGLWECPGGRVEPGELWRVALAREWLEELDVRVQVGVELTRMDFDPPVVQEPATLTFYAVDIGDQDPRPAEGQPGLVWAEPNEFDQYPMTPGNVAAVRLLRAAASASRRPESVAKMRRRLSIVEADSGLTTCAARVARNRMTARARDKLAWWSARHPWTAEKGLDYWSGRELTDAPAQHTVSCELTVGEETT